MKQQLEQFRHLREGGCELLVVEEDSEAIKAALLSRAGCKPLNSDGRGTVYRFALSDGEGVLREYRRGGFVGNFIGQTYVSDNRPLKELEVHDYLYREGLSVPQPLGIVWRRKVVLYSGAIATRYIDGTDVVATLQTGDKRAGEVIEKCAEQFLKMHDMGVVHGDLQVRNVLLSGDDVYLIDFDKSKRTEMNPLKRAQNLLRFRRSMDKHGIPLRFFEVLCKAYGEDKLPYWINRVYGATGAHS